MRTIDADALMADLEKWLKQIDPTHPPEDNAIPPIEDIIVSTLMTIEEQPTIEPQRMRGKWTYIKNVWVNHSVKICRCSVCNRPSYGGMDFCSRCGADMRGGQDETLSNRLPI